MRQNERACNIRVCECQSRRTRSLDVEFPCDACSVWTSYRLSVLLVAYSTWRNLFETWISCIHFESVSRQMNWIDWASVYNSTTNFTCVRPCGFALFARMKRLCDSVRMVRWRAKGELQHSNNKIADEIELKRKQYNNINSTRRTTVTTTFFRLGASISRGKIQMLRENNETMLPCKQRVHTQSLNANGRENSCGLWRQILWTIVIINCVWCCHICVKYTQNIIWIRNNQ